MRESTVQMIPLVQKQPLEDCGDGRVVRTGAVSPAAVSPLTALRACTRLMGSKQNNPLDKKKMCHKLFILLKSKCHVK